MRNFAAQVRYETRPDVRKVTREHFQRQRDAVCAAEREKQAADKLARVKTHEQYLRGALGAREDVRRTAEEIRSQRERIASEKEDEAAFMRQQRWVHQARRQRQKEELLDALRASHAVVMDNRFDPTASMSLDAEAFAEVWSA